MTILEAAGEVNAFIGDNFSRRENLTHDLRYAEAVLRVALRTIEEELSLAMSGVIVHEEEEEDFHADEDDEATCPFCREDAEEEDFDENEDEDDDDLPF